MKSGSGGGMEALLCETWWCGQDQPRLTQVLEQIRSTVKCAGREGRGGDLDAVLRAEVMRVVALP